MIARFEYDGDLKDALALQDRLFQAGLSAEACAMRAKLFAQAAAALEQAGAAAGDARPAGLYVPGRIEVLGKHTDYAGGRSLVAAAERGFSLVYAPRDDCRVTVLDTVLGESIAYEFDADLIPRAGHWGNYPMTVARRIARNFPGPLRGVNIAIASDLPPAAGMSSSSAFVVAVFLALSDVNRLTPREEFRRNVRSPIDLAGYLATIENGQTFGSLQGDRGVGTFGGSEDHTAILTCRPGRISQYAYCPVRFEREIPLPPGHVFAVGVSGVVAEKTGAAMAKYNAASQAARKLVEVWRESARQDDPHLAAVLARGPAAVDYLKSAVQTRMGREAAPLIARLDHFIAENIQILPAAGAALQRGELEEFGDLVDQSQRAAEELLGNQVPETSCLAIGAREAGAVAASAFGAGFGGGVWALVEWSGADAFLASWADSYRRRFPQHAEHCSFFLTAAGPAAFRIG